jgi:hypothetical protein
LTTRLGSEFLSGVPRLLALDLRFAADRLLLLCVVTDLFLIGLHGVYISSGLIDDPNYSIAAERGFGETFGYVKEGWIVLILAGLAFVRDRWTYGAWAFLFGVLMVDDVYGVRERIGIGIGQVLGLSPTFGLRPQDFGEVFVAALLGLALVPIVIAFRRSRGPVRAFSRSMLVLLAALVVFVVAVDVVHALMPPYSRSEAVFGTIEDGGEMLVLSLMLRVALATWFQSAEGVAREGEPPVEPASHG